MPILQITGIGEAVFGSTERCQLYTKSCAVLACHQTISHLYANGRSRLSLFIIPGFSDARCRMAVKIANSKPSNRSRLILDSGTPSILWDLMTELLNHCYVPAFVFPPGDTCGYISCQRDIPCHKRSQTPAATKLLLVMLVIVFWTPSYNYWY